MIDLIKDIIRSPFVGKRIGEYYFRQDMAFVSFQEWITKKEEEYREEHDLREKDSLILEKYHLDENEIKVISFEELEKYQLEDLQKEIADTDLNPTTANSDGFTIFTSNKTELDEKAKIVFAEYFTTHKKAVFAYADEDELNSNRSIRMNPWLKAEFSPNLLLEYFYFGNIFAVKNEVLKEFLNSCVNKKVSFVEDAVSKSHDSWKKIVYAFCLELIFHFILKDSFKDGGEQIAHVNYILMHSPANRKFGREKEFTALQKKYASSFVKRTKEVYSFDGSKLIRNENSELQEKMVSIVIPSKDHPKVLENCLASILRFSKKDLYEIIVVDNGSNEENKEKYLELKNRFGFHYIYKEEEFNFSAMCNRGAAVAKGDFILFLNDDIEVRASNWLSKMKEIAARKMVGAVGAKLYYPESTVLQHAGITNLYLGPVHKGQFLEDGDLHPYCPSKLNRDVLAVTGACLMMRKEILALCGGFSEDLAVAFNDVDLCFRLYEAGFFNVVCNDIHLWHHESLSRGDDESIEKQERLKQERRVLYEKHPGLYGRDPFYHPYMNQYILDVHDSFAYEYPYELSLEHPEEGELVKEITPLKNGLKPEWENECLIVSLEYDGTLNEFLTNKNDQNKKFYYLQGYAFVLEADNSCFDLSVIFENEEGIVYSYQYENTFRPDLNLNLSEDYHADMNGFSFVLDENALPKGKYRIGILAKCAVSRQRLFRMTGKYLTVE